ALVSCAQQEAPRLRRLEQVSRYRLDRDRAVDDGIRRLVDAAHPAFADQTDDEVLADLLHYWGWGAGKELCHRGPSAVTIAHFSIALQLTTMLIGFVSGPLISLLIRNDWPSAATS